MIKTVGDLMKSAVKECHFVYCNFDKRHCVRYGRS